ncbi:MAG TPA: bifunctional diguanylate cyclase/phosphodiesterase [Pilimelia sp.]|nr:bifunctional diguanylate cyclase/phosphodiesterase [Pilimelia sp.]
MTGDPAESAPRGPGHAPVDAPSGLPRRVVPLSAAVVALAAVAVLVGLLLPVTHPVDPPLSLPAGLAVAVGGLVLAQLARLRLRVDAGTVSLGWGEAALVVSLYLIPPGWLPGAVLIGSGAAVVLLCAFAERRSAGEMLHVAGSLTVAATLATAVTYAVAAPYGARLTPRLAVALVLGCATYLVVTTLLVALTLSLGRGLAFGTLVGRTLAGKLLMTAGNAVVGLFVVGFVGTAPGWLVLLPLVLLVLHQTYAQRLRADDERRAWQRLAEATRALNVLDQRAVAQAAVRGALTLFDAERVTVDVADLEGRPLRYLADADGVRVEPAGGAPPPVDPAAPVLGHPLRVGGLHVGELRVYYAPATLPPPRDQLALSAFGEALAAALHDAGTHHSLRLAQARSSYDAVHDRLTGLLNRAALLSQGDGQLRRTAADAPVALLLLDIDQFKNVNDTLGHAAGDELLRIVADRLRTVRRPGELLARLGGDEFALLVAVGPGAGELATFADRPAPVAVALRRARELAEQVSQPVEVAGVRLSAECSVGVVVCPGGDTDMTELLRRADVAMYQAKESGDGVAWYDSARDAGSTDELTLLAELRAALAVDDQLVLALQPAVDLVTGEPTGVEALIRWRHPRRGALGPNDFVRAVEGSYLLSAFTRYVVDKALRAAAEWARQGMPVPISVNVSARSLLDPRLPADVAELLRRHRVPAGRLVLEITETAAMSELGVIDEVLADLRAAGVQLAVDDFGTGYSSLHFLTRISVDELKVDRGFVARMVDSPEAAAIVRTTVDLGRELGLRVVAEGVETADQRAALAALGCTAAQGYHFFRPMPADKVVSALRTLRRVAPAKVVPLRADGAS